MAINIYLPIITLSVNGLNAPNKRHRAGNWIKNQDPSVCCLQRLISELKDTYRLKVRGWRKLFHKVGLFQRRQLSGTQAGQMPLAWPCISSQFLLLLVFLFWEVSMIPATMDHSEGREYRVMSLQASGHNISITQSICNLGLCFLLKHAACNTHWKHEH